VSGWEGRSENNWKERVFKKSPVFLHKSQGKGVKKSGEVVYNEGR